MSGGNCGNCGGCSCGGLKMRLIQFCALVSRAWSRETASPSCQGQWDPANPAYGQCAVTALLVQDRFGGDLLRTVAENRGSHYYNRLPNGWEVDLTRSQFPPDQRFEPADARTREYALDSPGAVAARTRERYELLKAAVARLEAQASPP